MINDNETDSEKSWLKGLEDGTIRLGSLEQEQREMMFLRREIAVDEARERWCIETCEHIPSFSAYIQEAKRNTPVPVGY